MPQPGLSLTASTAAHGQEEAAAEESRLQTATARAATLRNQQLAQLETLQHHILADRQEAWREGQELRQQAATDAAALKVRSDAGVGGAACTQCLGKSPLHQSFSREAPAWQEADRAQRAARAGQRIAAEQANVALATARAQEREREQAADAAIAGELCAAAICLTSRALTTRCWTCRACAPQASHSCRKGAHGSRKSCG